MKLMTISSRMDDLDCRKFNYTYIFIYKKNIKYLIFKDV